MQTIEQLTETIYYILTSPSKIDEDNLINIILTNNSDRRLAIANLYKHKYNQDGIKADLKKRLSRDFKDVVCHLFSSLEEYDCYQLKRSFKAFDTDEECIYEILTTRPLSHLNELKVKYQELHSRVLENEIKKNFSAELGRNLLLLMNTERRVNHNPDHRECERNADILIKVNKIESWVTNEEIFKNIFVKQSPEEIVLTARYYLQKTNNNLLNVVYNQLSSKSKSFLVELLLNVVNPSEGFANKLNQSIKGLGTDTNQLERVLITRNEIDMDEIRRMYQRRFEVTLESDIEDDTSGAYQKLLLGLAKK